MDELVEDEVLEVVELDDVELEAVELDVMELEVVVDVVLLTELDVPRDQESAFSISASLPKKWNNIMSSLIDVSKVDEMRKDCLRSWEQRIQEWEFPYLWSWMMKILSSLLRIHLTWMSFASLTSLKKLCLMLDDLRVSMAFWGGIYELRIVS